ncbi:MAG: thioredoxin family protein [Bacteroidota bacterium]
MKIHPILFSIFCLLFVSLKALPQSTEKIENFTLTDVTNNRSVSLLDYKGSQGVVIIFTSHACPYAKLYDSRIHNLAKEFQGRGIQFLLINSNTSTEDNDDSIEQMAAAARQKGYSFPYLADKEHRAAKMFGATKTPEAFVLQTNGGVFTLKYRGAIDDNPQMPNDVSAHYLREAIQAVLGKTNLSVVDRRATGCMIKKE